MDIKEIRTTRMKKAMSKRDINARELARRSGISESGISRILAGEIEPRLKTFIKIADSLDCDYKWLMGYDEESVEGNEEQSIPSNYFKLNPDTKSVIDHLINELAKAQEDTL